MRRKVYSVAWPNGLRRWFQAWVRIPPLPSVSFYKVNDSSILSSQIELFFSFVTFLFLLSLFFFIKKGDLKTMRRKSKSKPRYYSLSRKDPHAETKEKHGERVKPPAITQLVVYGCVYTLITLGDVQIKFETTFVQKQKQGRLTDLTKAHLPFLCFETSR